ncbi:chaperonin 10-like protein [Fusarium flagelliforme]|uniref:chaperonin 10-like protein n=1 Tax=Fusarium flagelliforme TaxID=2675880 RepID=UPI001E8DE598|nr:chaperonin 10-like protein [Fusarium flagelliforme]KAH7186246.1 chaperonin 10-like protein [Fusarium flagelliforme]
MRALVLNTSSSEVAVQDVARPTPASGEVLIHVQAIALNPVDELYVNNPIAAQETRIIGTDFAGVVVEAAAEIHDASDPRVKPGTRVAGFLQGACSVNDRPGAFAKYIVIPYDLVWAIPEAVSLEEASTISMCGLTAAQALFVRLGLSSPFSTTTSSQLGTEADKPINIFIYGSSTSVGLYAAQLAHVASATSGRSIRLIGAASSSKHDMLREKPYSYDVLVDYRDRDWVEKVKSATDGDGVDFALDCISEKDTVYNTYETLAPTAKFAVIRGPVGGEYDPAQMSVKPMYGAVWEGLGVEVGYNGSVLPANPDAHSFAKDFYTFLSSPRPSGKARLEPNPVRLMPGGLDRVVPDGFALLGSGSVSQRTRLERSEDYMRPISGEKLVYNIG